MDNRARQNFINRVVRAKVKEEAIAYKGGACEHCLGVYHFSAFDFHHIDPNEKDVNPGNLMRRSKEVLYLELDKCILLCANCHRIHHYKERDPAFNGELPAAPYLESRAKLFEYDGRSQPVNAWAKEYGLPSGTLYNRLIKSCWSMEKALTTPIGGSKGLLTLDGVTKSYAHWARDYGLSSTAVRGRLRLGWDVMTALTTPLGPTSKRNK